MAQKITVDKDFILYHAVQLPEWQRKQIALVLIGSTLTPESAHEAFATVSMLPTDELHHKVFGGA